MKQEFILEEHPHTRLNILTGESVLVSPHRSKRPWQGKVEDLAPDNRPAYDPSCYLCAGNKRSDGTQNPDYKDSFVFVNDFSALLQDTPDGELNDGGLLVAKSAKGICKVISFTPEHNLTLPEMSVEAITKVVNLWQEEYVSLRANSWIKYIQIFENKGEIMGCSNPHPHGQIWAQASIPQEVLKECQSQKKHFAINGKSLLSAYLELELEKQERILFENKHFVVLVPFWAVWPFETMIISKKHVTDISYFNATEKKALAEAIKWLTTRYDNLFQTSFPYSAGMHQMPVNSGNLPEWHWHMHFYPPLLRSATVKKFMVGYELLANPQRDITPEYAAQRLRELPDLHYKSSM
ncbi:MAG: UDP-glucose--hexose-1-phosphate uridylyltransferase [Pedobacter sp.]|nr:MAG: UDP-glucose--hexose-1-phosphate uridylyltransferase [Pedobacter sp.]